MTYEEAIQTIPCGRYRHFKGNEYEVIGIARHSEDESPMVVYRALYEFHSEIKGIPNGKDGIATS